MLQAGIALYEMHGGNNRVAVTLGVPQEPDDDDKEGELCLHLEMNSKKLFSLCFTIVPGWVVGSQAEESILITCLQGCSGRYLDLKIALSMLGEYSPKKTLIAALQGIARALEIDELTAVTALNQNSYRKERAADLIRAYDKFFTSIGMSAGADGFFRTSLPLECKPLDLLKTREVPKALRRRATRLEIQSASSRIFSGVGNPTLNDLAKRDEIIPEVSSA